MGTKPRKRPSKAGKIKIQKEGDKKEEVAVLSMTLSQKSEKLVWNWLEEVEEVTVKWSETLITGKKK